MKRFLEFLRLVDAHDGQLSLTNIALIVVIVKLALIQNAGLTDIGALLLALANYNYKKVLNSDVGDSNEPAVPSALQGQVDEMKTRLNAVAIRLGLGGGK
jgi:hypothetical protein